MAQEEISNARKDAAIAERMAFTERLKQGMQKTGLRASPTHLARAFNSTTKGDKITVHAARKWIVGEAIPTQHKIQELAAMLGCESQWLRFGGDDAVFKLPDVSADERTLVQLLRKLSDAERLAVTRLVQTMVATQAIPKMNPDKPDHPYFCRCSNCV